MQAFFANVAKARTVKTILQQCYGNKATVTDELVEKVILSVQGLCASAARWKPQLFSPAACSLECVHPTCRTAMHSGARSI